MDATLLDLFRSFGIAILLGTLIGVERERSGAGIAGMRTIALVSLFGAGIAFVGQHLDNSWLIGVGLLVVTALYIMGVLSQSRRESPAGMTTAAAMLVSYLCGNLVALGFIPLAIAISFATTTILYFKPHLHAFSRKLEPRDIYAVFQFGLVSFIILPILPDEAYGPFDAINFQNIWLMVVFISGLSLVGYVVMKLVGQRWGGPMLGVLGGIVSSTATTLAFSRHASKNHEFSRMAAVVVILASAVVMARIGVLVTVLNPELMLSLSLPLILMLLAGLLVAALAWRHASSGNSPVPEPKNPAELKGAVIFGVIYGLVLLATSAGNHYFGTEGVYLVSFVSGLTDVDAVVLTNARLAQKGALDLIQARNATLIAILSNLLFKLILTRVLGTAKLAFWCALGFGSIALMGLSTMLL